MTASEVRKRLQKKRMCDDALTPGACIRYCAQESSGVIDYNLIFLRHAWRGRGATTQADDCGIWMDVSATGQRKQDDGSTFNVMVMGP